MYPPVGVAADPWLEAYFGASGEPLERSVADSWVAPRWLATDSAFLIWCVADGSPTPGRRRVRSAAGLLENFLELGLMDDKALPRAVRRFAGRWGVLNLCDHVLPATHSTECWRRPPLRPAPRPGWIGAWREPIEGWRIYARKAVTMLRLAAKLERDELGVRPPLPREREGFFGSDAWVGDEDWVQFYSWPTLGQWGQEKFGSVDDAGRVLVDGQLAAHERVEVRGARPDLGSRQHRERRLNNDRNTVAAEANAWVRLAQVSPQLEWRDSRPLLHLGGGSLFAALGVQVLLRLAHAEGLALCGGCPRMILHGRRAPRLDRANYCEDCRLKGMAQRHAKQRYRASRREMRLS
jgi:hypothetical protein